MYLTSDIMKKLIEQCSSVELRELGVMINNELETRVVIVLSPTEEVLLRDGRLIDTIKSVRSRTHCCLRDAKDVCDRWRSERGL